MKKSSKGFTLVEILLTLVMSSIVTTAIYTVYISHNKSYIRQEQIVEVQQNIRAAMLYLSRDIRIAGYDPLKKGIFGFTKIDFRDIDNNSDVIGYNSNDLTAFSSIQFSFDDDEDGILDSNETISYALYDYPTASPDGRTDLSRSTGKRRLIAEGIEAIAFAYAYDNDEDGRIDVGTTNGNIIWAIDSDNDSDLDKNLDTNDDGNIDINDTIGGTPLVSDVTLDKIKTVRIWILARAKKITQEYSDTRTYVVGNKRISPADGFQRRLLMTTVQCRNMGL